VTQGCALFLCAAERKSAREPLTPKAGCCGPRRRATHLSNPRGTLRFSCFAQQIGVALGVITKVRFRVHASSFHSQGRAKRPRASLRQPLFCFATPQTASRALVPFGGYSGQSVRARHLSPGLNVREDELRRRRLVGVSLAIVTCWFLAWGAVAIAGTSSCLRHP
jgi:hypothetical protein